MKTLPSGLAAHYAQPVVGTAIGLRIQRTDGQVYAYTTHDADATVGGTTYHAGPGFDVQSIAYSAGLAVGNLELTILPDDTAITADDLIAGRWDSARFALIRYAWGNPAAGAEPLMSGSFGNVTRLDRHFKVELRDVRQALQQTVGAVTTPTCRYGSIADPRCGVDVPTFTRTGTFTSVASRSAATDAARTEPDDWFAEGVLTITSGLNAGLSQKVRAYAAGAFTFSRPFAFDIAVGTTYSAYAGCRKRRTEDCHDKFDNVRRFGGEPDLPGADTLVVVAKA